jgi:prepilin-type N-terminal cleavage/methylation domain-containing protein
LDRPAAGFTLIESLVAMMVISITVISITPPILWATATRVQNRRAEQAVQLAQSEIDRVRVSVDRQQYLLNEVPPQTTVGGVRPNPLAPVRIRNEKLRSIVPACNRDDGTQPNDSGDLIPVDTDPETDGSCRPEFLVQVFRGQDARGPANTNTQSPPDGFVMGVRVYAYAARDNVASGRLQTQAAALRLTNGLGGQTTRPLAVQYSTIVRSNLSDGVDLYRQLCQGGSQSGC